MVRALASHQCGPGLIPRLSVMWVELVVVACPCSMRFFSGYSGFPLSSKTNISKFQFDLERVSNECFALNTLTLNKVINFIFIFFELLSITISII